MRVSRNAVVDLDYEQERHLAWNCWVYTPKGYVLMDSDASFWLAEASDFAYWLHTYNIPRNARPCSITILGRQFRWSTYAGLPEESLFIPGRKAAK